MATKYVTIGQITESESKTDGSKYLQLVLNAEFLASPKGPLAAAYTDKKGGKRFSLYPPRPSQDGKPAPDWVKFNVVVKLEE